MIEFCDVSFFYHKNTPFQKLALNKISFKIDTGDCLGIVGASGSGKSTLAQHMNGLLIPDEGKIIIDGEEITNKTTNTANIRKKVGLVFQFPEDQLFEETVFRDVSYGIRNRGLSYEETENRIRLIFKLFNLDFNKLFFRSPFELSGGEKRKIAMAGIFIMEYSTLVLDEPTAGLDPVSLRDTLMYIEKIKNEDNKTIIIISHNMEIIARLCNKVIALKNGEVKYFGKMRDILKQGSNLREIGLSLPLITNFMHTLKRKGLNIREDVFTVSEACEELIKL
ncbi:MAG: energy-coupling factor transporter ATPase [Candidatus Firestonebacteria bacterium]|nr:energy-coupling factor transporter ATPase [Candidatus Firestonebacteria bacterium]